MRHGIFFGFSIIGSWGFTRHKQLTTTPPPPDPAGAQRQPAISAKAWCGATPMWAAGRCLRGATVSHPAHTCVRPCAAARSCAQPCTPARTAEALWGCRHTAEALWGCRRTAEALWGCRQPAEALWGCRRIDACTDTAEFYRVVAATSSGRRIGHSPRYCPAPSGTRAHTHEYVQRHRRRRRWSRRRRRRSWRRRCRRHSSATCSSSHLTAQTRQTATARRHLKANWSTAHPPPPCTSGDTVGSHGLGFGE